MYLFQPGHHGACHRHKRPIMDWGFLSYFARKPQFAQLDSAICHTLPGSFCLYYRSLMTPPRLSAPRFSCCSSMRRHVKHPFTDILFFIMACARQTPRRRRHEHLHLHRRAAAPPRESKSLRVLNRSGKIADAIRSHRTTCNFKLWERFLSAICPNSVVRARPKFHFGTPGGVDRRTGISLRQGYARQVNPAPTKIIRTGGCRGGVYPLPSPLPIKYNRRSSHNFQKFGKDFRTQPGLSIRSGTLRPATAALIAMR